VLESGGFYGIEIYFKYKQLGIDPSTTLLKQASYRTWINSIRLLKEGNRMSVSIS